MKKLELDLEDEELAFLRSLEGNPCDVSVVLGALPVERVKKLNSLKLIYFEPTHCIFYITSSGIEQLRIRGDKVKHLPHIQWRHNPDEMTADRAIELFAPSEVLVNEAFPTPPQSKSRPKFRVPTPPIVKKSKKL